MGFVLEPRSPGQRKRFVKTVFLRQPGGDGLSAAGIFLAGWGVFLAGASPALYGGDAGELLASAVSLGVSHAPGYPLHALLGKAAAALAPWGGMAYRVNLLSAFLSAFTVAGVYLFVRKMSGGFFPAVAGALFYAALPIVWDQAQTAEVFALNNLLALAILGSFAAADRQGLERPVAERLASGAPSALIRSPWLSLAGFATGIALANHQTIVLLAPAFAMWVWARRPAWKTVAKALARVLIFIALGYSLNLFLFFRAAQHPPVNFGDPHTTRRFMDVLTRREFGSLELHPSALPERTPGILWEQARAFTLAATRQTGAPAIMVGLLVLVWFFRRPQVPGKATIPPQTEWGGMISFRPLLVFAVLAGPLFFFYSNLSPTNTLAQWRMERFLLLPALGGAVLFGLSLSSLWQWKRPAALLAGAVVLLSSLQTHKPWFRWNLDFRDFGRNVTASLPPGSLLLIDSLFFDEPTSCLLNRLVVERQRLDLRVIYRPGTLFELFYGEDILEIPRPLRPARQKEREDALWAANQRPRAALAFSKENLPPGQFVIDGLVYKEGKSSVPGHFFMRRRGMGAAPRDYPTSLINIHEPYFQAKAAFESNDPSGASQAAALCAAQGRRMEWLLSNLGGLWSRAHARAHWPDALPAAHAVFNRALSVDPYFAPAHFGMGYVLMEEKNMRSAVQSFTAAARWRPGWTEAHYMEGVAALQAGQSDKAREALNNISRTDPANPLTQALRAAVEGK